MQLKGSDKAVKKQIESSQSTVVMQLKGSNTAVKGQTK